jgi:hypothetical protein
VSRTCGRQASPTILDLVKQKLAEAEPSDKKCEAPGWRSARLLEHDVDTRRRRDATLRRWFKVLASTFLFICKAADKQGNLLSDAETLHIS